jgi:hypothetical protein
VPADTVGQRGDDPAGAKFLLVSGFPEADPIFIVPANRTGGRELGVREFYGKGARDQRLVARDL